MVGKNWQVKVLGSQDITQNSNFMAHSAVWGYLPNQRQNTNSKELMIEKLPETDLRRGKKLGQAHLKNEWKIRLSLIWHLT